MQVEGIRHERWTRYDCGCVDKGDDNWKLCNKHRVKLEDMLEKE